MLDYAGNDLGNSASMMAYQTVANDGNFFGFADCVSPRQNAFVLSSPPLAALHGMQDLKASQMSNSMVAAANCSASYGYSYGMKGCLNQGTPHGISDILSRPDLHAFAQRLGGSGTYYASQQSPPSSIPRSAKNLASDLHGRTSLYWSGGLNAPSWHKAGGGTAPEGCGSSDGLQLLPPASSPDCKDGKKKNTRPTFTGQQIFALEKTFEQTKYLAGPDRGRLAYGLGMTESQVKVWFQNRRTKWRKKHAADMATAKRKQDRQSDSSSSNAICSESCSSSPLDSYNQQQQRGPCDLPGI